MFSSKLILIKTLSRQGKKQYSPRSLMFAFAEYCWGLGFDFYDHLFLLLLGCYGLTRWIQLLKAPNSPLLFWASQCLALVSATKIFNTDMYIYTHTYTYYNLYLCVNICFIYFFFFCWDRQKSAAFSRKMSSLLFSYFYPLQDAIHFSEFLQ